MYSITSLAGTCSCKVIGDLALLHSRPASWKNACKKIKEFSPELYKELALDLFNPWWEETNIKKINNIKYLHVIHSCVDYLFIIE